MGRLKLESAVLAGRYLIQRPLAVGSRNEIFLARDASNGQLVVVKARCLEGLDRPLNAGEAAAHAVQFRREGVWLERLCHPHIVRRLSGGAARDLDGAAFDYHVLEYLAGGDLAAVSEAAGGLPLAETLRLLRQAVVALTHCHTLGVIHQDLEPSNLLLAADRQTLKLADFDAAASDEDAESGNPVFYGGDAGWRPRLYLPPECRPGQSAPLSATTDVYALAKTFYAVVAGGPPADRIGQPIAALPPQLAALPTAGALLQVLSRATAIQVTDRYPTVADFWSDVERVAAAESVLVAPVDLRPVGVEPGKPQTVADGSDGSPSSSAPALPVTDAAPEHSSAENLPPLLTTRLIGVGVALACVALFIGGLTALYRFTRESVREQWRGRPPAAAPARSLFHVKVITPTKVQSAPTENPTRRDWLGDLSVGTEADVLEIRGNFYRVRPQKWARRKDASTTEGWIVRESVDGGL